MVGSGGPETLLGDLCVRRACGCFNGWKRIGDTKEEVWDLKPLDRVLLMPRTIALMNVVHMSRQGPN